MARKRSQIGRRLYIVHAAADYALAAFLKSECERIASIEHVFVASKAGQIPTGTDWLADIHQNLRSADLYLLLWTPRSIDRHWVWYEAGAAWRSGRQRIPIAAAGLDRVDIPLPLGATQCLALDDAENAKQLFKDLGGELESAEEFCAKVRELALPADTEVDEKRLRQVRQAFGELGEPPRSVLRRMLDEGGLTLSALADGLAKLTFVADPVSVERMLQALKDRELVQGDAEGCWRVKPELETAVRSCFRPPSLSTRLAELAQELNAWVSEQNGLIDPSAFNQRFRNRLDLLRDKAANDFAEGDRLLSAVPSSAGGVRNVARAVAEVARRVHSLEQ